jgi:hypothetical protein
MLPQAEASAQEVPRSTNYTHGASGYRNHGCRCEICRAGHRERLARYRANSSLNGPTDPRHGTDNGYRNHGCRCEICRLAHREVARSASAATLPHRVTGDPDDGDG